MCSVNPSATSGTRAFQTGGTAYVPEQIFWIVALLNLYSVVSHVFPLTTSFSNTVNTVEGNGNDIEKEGGLPVFDNDILNTFFSNC